MISYELILSSAVIIVIMLTGSFNYTSIIESQQSIWFIVPLAPIFMLFFISILAETSRVPFDLQEATKIKIWSLKKISLNAGKIHFFIYILYNI